MECFYFLLTCHYSCHMQAWLKRRNCWSWMFLPRSCWSLWTRGLALQLSISMLNWASSTLSSLSWFAVVMSLHACSPPSMVSCWGSPPLLLLGTSCMSSSDCVKRVSESPVRIFILAQDLVTDKQPLWASVLCRHSLELRALKDDEWGTLLISACICRIVHLNFCFVFPAGNPPLPNPYGDTNLTAPVMPVQQLVAEILFVRTSYVKKIIEDCSNSEETVKLLRFSCWENPQFSSTVLSELLWQVNI